MSKRLTIWGKKEVQGLAVYGESEDREILVKEGFRTGAKKDSFVLFLNFMSYEKNCYYGVKIENDVICRVKTPQLSYLQENHYYIFEAKDWIYTHGFGHVLFDEERDAEKEGEEKGFPLYTDCELHQQQREGRICKVAQLLDTPDELYSSFCFPYAHIHACCEYQPVNQSIFCTDNLSEEFLKKLIGSLKSGEKTFCYDFQGDQEYKLLLDDHLTYIISDIANCRPGVAELIKVYMNKYEFAQMFHDSMCADLDEWVKWNCRSDEKYEKQKAEVVADLKELQETLNQVYEKIKKNNSENEMYSMGRKIKDHIVEFDSRVYRGDERGYECFRMSYFQRYKTTEMFYDTYGMDSVYYGIRLDDFMGEEHKMLAISDNLKLLKKEGYDIVSSIEEGMEQLQGESYNGSRY